MAGPPDAGTSGSYVSVFPGVEHTFWNNLDSLVHDQVMSRISDKDATLWGPQAESEAAIRLAWTDLHHTSRALADEIIALRVKLNTAGLTHVVLCGMGGSSLAPEVMCRTAGVELTLLDSSHPDIVRRTLNDRLDSSIVVVSSKSGSTVETDSQKRAFEQAFEQSGLDPVDHIIIVTDPDSPLAENAHRCGYRLFNADPHVGGRYSALTAFGLVPSGLAGVDIIALLEEAAAVAPTLSADAGDNPAARLGAFLGAAYSHDVDKIALLDTGSQTVGFVDWIEQLIAESTGKLGRGLLPVPIDTPTLPTVLTPDEAIIRLGGPADTPAGRPKTEAEPATVNPWTATIEAPLGTAILIWEYAIAVTGRLIGINPFDQPDVDSAKQAARDLLEGTGTSPAPVFTHDRIDVYGVPTDDLGQRTIAGALSWLCDQLDPDAGYLAVHAYLDPGIDSGFASVQSPLAQRVQRPVTFGWGPRFLHSTGQYHKGGPPTGVFLQLTAEPEADLAIPGREFTFGAFIHSQAAGDADVLTNLGRPVLRLHLHDASAGLAYLRGVLA